MVAGIHWVKRRNACVETVFVNSQGNAWTGYGLGGSFNRVRDEAGIVHEDGGKKQLHDVWQTFATKLILAGISDSDIASVMAWSPDQVQALDVFVLTNHAYSWQSASASTTKL